jgi:Cu/Ag efflux pump CusA
VQSRLPSQARASLGPDATGVGWVYEYALVDRTGRMDLSQLRALQDWFLKYELKTVPNVSEVASIGGMVRQYQIVLNPRSPSGVRHRARQGDRSGAKGESGDRRLGPRARRG